MPFRQPVQTTIRTDDFKNKSFSFPVESVLKPEKGFGRLFIEASDGYLLATPQHKDPKPVLVLDHVLQPDGSRVAQGMVIVKAVRKKPASGTVTIRTSSESLVIPINNLGELGQTPVTPVLSVSHSAPVFPVASPGRPSMLELAITQQHADTAVRITTNSPEHFQMALDTGSTFAAGLLVTPSATGTPILVRYSPTALGRHTALMTIDAPYEKKTIVLTGRSMETAVRQPDASAQVLPDNQGTILLGGPWPKAIALVVVGILTCVGYAYRCEIAPELCRPAMAVDLPMSGERPAGEPMVNQTPAQPVWLDTMETTPLDVPSVETRTEQAISITTNEPDRIEQSTVQPKPSRGKLTTEQTPPQPPRKPKRSMQDMVDDQSQMVARSRQRPVDTSLTAESDLERELNRKSNQ